MGGRSVRPRDAVGRPARPGQRTAAPWAQRAGSAGQGAQQQLDAFGPNLAEIISHGQDWSEFAAHHSRLHASRFKRRPLSNHRLAALEALTWHSMTQQMALEAGGQVPFEPFLASYFDQYRAIPSAAFEREAAALTCTPLRAV